MSSSVYRLVILSVMLAAISCQKSTNPISMSSISKPAEVPLKDSLDKNEVVIPNKEPSPPRGNRAPRPQQSANVLKGKYLTTGLNQFRNLIESDLAKKNRQAKATELADTMVDSIDMFEFRYDIVNQSANLLLVTRSGNTLNRQMLIGRYQSNQMQLSNPERSVEAKVICLDAIDNQCFESYIELKFKTLNQARVGLIYRRRNANYVYTSISRLLVHPRAETFASYLRNSVSKQVQLPWVTTVVVDSFEVINGRSGLRLSLLGNDGMLFSSLANLGYTQAQLASMHNSFKLSSDFSHIGVELRAPTVIDGNKLVEKMFLLQTNPLLDQFTVRFEYAPYRHIGGIAFDIPFLMPSTSTINVSKFRSRL